MHARHYLGLLTGTALLATAVIATLDRWSPAGSAAIDGRYVLEKKTAEIVAGGRPVVLARHLHEWMLRWDIARLLPAAPDAVVLGSSHSLVVTAEMLGAQTSMNFSISGSALSDHLVTAGILEGRALRPRRWVIFVDAWLFDPGADFGAWRLGAADLLRMEGLLGRRAQPPLEPAFPPAPPAAAEPAWRRYSLDPVVQELDGRLNDIFLNAYPAPDGIVDATVLERDGAMRATSDRRPANADGVRRLALQQFGGKPDRRRYGSYERIDEALWQYFEQWVLHCGEQGEVWLVLSPYHPAIYPDIAAIPQNQLTRIEARVRKFARQSGLPVLGSYDPSVAAMAEEDFADGDHLRGTGLQRLLAPLAGSPSPSPSPAAPAH